MPRYTAPTKDLQFLLHDVFGISNEQTPGYADLDRDFTAAVLEEAGKLASEVIAPLNIVGDTEGCRFENGIVLTPTGFKEAFDALRDGEWTGLDLPAEYGGQGLPHIMGSALNELMCGANQAFAMYQVLTHGAASAILAHGTAQQKDTYLPKMVSCAWTGTMNLTEPHCGTDLGLMRTKAAPQADGSYAITGQKIFISAGEHDMADNIVHLVLAKIPGGPEGIKGVSLFIVPKFLVNEDGSLGARNGVSCGKIEEKMGIHGNSTCVMNYDGATGYLLGAPHKGMRAMFTMMNEARLLVGVQGVAQAEAAYQNALDYALDRLQGRDVAGAQAPDAPADPLIVHPDVRRILMDQKSFIEAGRAFTLWGAQLVDQAHDDLQADALLGLLNPVLKGFLSDQGFEMTISAQQVYGGHGYIEEWGMSQFARDVRIAQIYEGANGVQALDLVSRKLQGDGGAAMQVFLATVEKVLNTQATPDFENSFHAPLRAATADLKAASDLFLQNGTANLHDTLAGSADFMHLFGHVCLALMWVKMARASEAALGSATPDPDFHQANLATARYYMQRRLPATAMHLARIRSGAAPVMSLAPEQF